MITVARAGPISPISARRAARCAVHNRDLASRLVAAGVDEGRVHVLPLGVDPARFTPGPAAPDPRLLYVGRFLAWKGLHHLVAAMPTVRAAVPGATLHMVGPLHDSAYADDPKLEEWVERWEPVIRASVAASRPRTIRRPLS